jgi:hypothetical protein
MSPAAAPEAGEPDPGAPDLARVHHRAKAIIRSAKLLTRTTMSILSTFGTA